MKTNKNRIAYIETAARRFARSGAYFDFHGIEYALVESGYPEARKVFRNLWTRNEINRICEAHFSKGRKTQA